MQTGKEAKQEQNMMGQETAKKLKEGERDYQNRKKSLRNDRKC